MKTNSSRQQNKGSVLLVTLVITGILGLTLASYLTLIAAQNRSVARSQNWNSSIPISEAGVEEAIVHLNRNCLYSDITSAPVDWNADHWQSVPGGISKTNSLGDTYYEVTIITNGMYSTNSPGIFSKGFVPALLSQVSSDTMFATVGAAADAQQPTSFVGRQVKVTAGQSAFFSRAMVAKNSINLDGKRVGTDSFDSEKWEYSTDGLYDPTKKRYYGDVAVNNGLIDTLDVGNAQICGSVAVGPGGEIAIGAGGKVGDAEWMADASKTGIQPGHSRDDMNVSFDDVSIPFTNGNADPDLNQWITNIVVTSSNTTNSSVSYPTSPGFVYTNTVSQTTASYPASGTYVGSIITNTVYVTSNYPSAGTYVGLISTNTATVTSTTKPSSGTYLGTVITNTTLVTANSKINVYGTVTTNYLGNSSNIRDYTYRQITGYTYEAISQYSYYHITGYTVAHITGYTLVQKVYYTNTTIKFYEMVFNDGDYRCSTLNGRILVRGNARILVTDDVSITGSSEGIFIDAHARLKLYMGGESFRLGGLGVVNESGIADNFYYYGLPTNTDIGFVGNAGFTGVIYAPQADFDLGGGGVDTYDFIGATVTKSVHMRGHFNFHYDEALARKGPSRGFIISGWDEISLTETPATP
jgi:hypothetical protein